MNQDNKQILRYVLAALVPVFALSIWLVFSSFGISRATGGLDVSSNDSNASLSVTQEGRQAVFIGVGHSKVRLKPGIYILSASDNGRQSSAVTTIIKGHTTKTAVNPDSASHLPTVSNIDFQGISGLYDNGFSDTQVNLFKYYVFSFNKAAKIATVKDSSIYPGAHNPDTDIGFSLKFNLTIDGKAYRAVATYISLSDLDLKLYQSSNGGLVFSSR